MSCHSHNVRFRPDGTAMWQYLGDGVLEAQVPESLQRVSLSEGETVIDRGSKSLAAALGQVINAAIADEVRQRRESAANEQEREQPHGDTAVQDYGVIHTHRDDTPPPQ